MASAAIIEAPAEALGELSALRTLQGKTFDLGGGKRRLVTGLKPVHVPSNIGAWQRNEATTWEDIDCSIIWDEKQGVYRVARCWYDLRILPNDVHITYTSLRDGSTTTMRLAQLNGVDIETLGAVFKPEVDGECLVFTDIVAGLDVSIECHCNGIRTPRKIKSALAPKSFSWDIETVRGVHKVESKMMGWDNFDRADPARSVETLARKVRRGLQVTAVETNTTEDASSKRTRLVEVWTGKTVELDPLNHAQSLKVDTVFPVVIA